MKFRIAMVILLAAVLGLGATQGVASAADTPTYGKSAETGNRAKKAATKTDKQVKKEKKAAGKEQAKVSKQAKKSAKKSGKKGQKSGTGTI